jgi:hypothetical protein
MRLPPSRVPPCETYLTVSDWKLCRTAGWLAGEKYSRPTIPRGKSASRSASLANKILQLFHGTPFLGTDPAMQVLQPGVHRDPCGWDGTGGCCHAQAARCFSTTASQTVPELVNFNGDYV